MKANAFIRLCFHSRDRLDIIFKALDPESKKILTPRSKAILERNDNYLVVKVEAEDTAALRAKINTYLRWINSMVDILEVLERITQNNS